MSATPILFSLRNTCSGPRFASITNSQRPGRTGVAQGVEVVGAEEQKGGRLRGVCDLRGEGLPAGF